MPPHDWEVRADKLGRIVRMLRIRQRLTQVALAAKAGVSRRTVSLVERNRADELPLRVIDAIVNALGARLDVRLFWHGPELDRLLDADHAALAALLKPRLESWGWIVRVEVSYSRFGERGRIDLLAWHPLTRTLLVVEVKTDLVDIQGLLGSVDAKARLAVHVSRDIGWDVRSVVPAITFPRIAPYAIVSRSWTPSSTDTSFAAARRWPGCVGQAACREARCGFRRSIDRTLLPPAAASTGRGGMSAHRVPARSAL